MDVQTIDSGVPAAASLAQGPVAPPIAPDPTDGTTPAPAGAAAALTPSGAAPSGDSSPPQASLPGGIKEHSSTLSAVTKALLGATVTVSYDTISEEGHVITVFKDAHTGQTIFRLPPEVIIQLAGFFDQVAGAVVDKKA